MIDHPDLQRHDLVARRLRDRGPVAPVDAGMGNVKQHIQNPRPRRPLEQPVEELSGLGPYAGQGRDGREEGVEEIGAHDRGLAGLNAWDKRPISPDKRPLSRYTAPIPASGIRSAGFAACAKEVCVPESTLSSVDLDPRRRRALFRAWHRGMREMDILFGKFADANLPTFTEAELTEFESLMEELDRDVLMWLTGETPTPPERQTPFFGRLQAFHTHSGPINV